MMKYLIIYDIKIKGEGKKRLRKIAKECENFGFRVQDSCFELEMTAQDLLSLKTRIIDILDKDSDSVRIYQISSKPNSVEILGCEESLDVLNGAPALFL